MSGMKHRRAGRTDLELPVVCFGAWAIGGWAWGGTDEAAAVAAMRAGFDEGMDAVDTAPVYGFGLSEQLVGRALEGRRGRVKVLTKVGLRWGREEGPLFFESRTPSGEAVRVHRNSRPESVREEVDESLARIGVERLDLVQVHWPDPSTPIAETMGALAELRSAGKIGEIGVSNYSVEQLEEARVALGDVPLATDQPRYSLVDRSIDAEILPWARRHGVGILAYSPLEQGLLTGRMDPARTFPKGDARAERWTLSRANRIAVNARLERYVQPIAAAHRASVAQVVIAATVAREGITAALVGARGPEQAVQNARAGALDLSDDELAAMQRAFGSFFLRHPASWRGRLLALRTRLLGR